MQEADPYRRLVEITESERTIIDPYIMTQLAILATDGINVNTIALPMLAAIRPGKLELLKPHATVYAEIGGIVSLAATPAQLLELLTIQEIFRLEASRPAGEPEWE